MLCNLVSCSFDLTQYLFCVSEHIIPGRLLDKYAKQNTTQPRAYACMVSILRPRTSYHHPYKPPTRSTPKIKQPHPHSTLCIDEALETYLSSQDIVFRHTCCQFRCALQYRELFIRFDTRLLFAYQHISCLGAL